MSKSQRISFVWDFQKYLVVVTDIFIQQCKIIGLDSLHQLIF